MFPSWIPAHLDARAEREDIQAQQDRELRKISPQTCLDIIETTLGQLRRLTVNSRDREEVFLSVRKNIGLLLSKDVPGNALPPARREILQNILEQNPLPLILMQLEEFRSELLVVLTGVREFLEASMQETQAMPDDFEKTPQHGRPASYVPMCEKYGVMNVDIGSIGEPDVEKIMKIRKLSFTTAGDEKDLRNCLAMPDHKGVVAKFEGSVVGYLLFQIRDGHIRIVDVAVDPVCRRRRIGEQLANAAKQSLRESQVERITIDVRETNKSAQNFWASQDFLATDVERQAFEDTGEDAFHMEFNANGYIGPSRVNNRLKPYFEAMDKEKNRWQSDGDSVPN